MKLTIEQVAKVTKLSVPTLRVYVSRLKLGTKAGNKRVFSQEDVKKLLKGASSGKMTKGAAPKKPAAKKAAPKKAARAAAPKAKAAKTPEVKAQPAKAKETKAPAQPKSEKNSFWSIFQRKPKERIGIMDAKGFKK